MTFIEHTWQPFHELRPPRRLDIYKVPAKRNLMSRQEGKAYTYLKDLGDPSVTQKRDLPEVEH